MEKSDPKNIPQIEQLLKEPSIVVWFKQISRQLTLNIIRSSVSRYREHILKGNSFDREELLRNIETQCKAVHNLRIRPVINASGIILHTNMGRTPLPPEVWNECRDINTGYSNLELSLKTGRRGKRNGLIPLLIQQLTGAETSIVVNNNAAAVLLMLTVLAKDREVIVSRGEQVQIGGGFRIPDILELSGARLIEVGTTNITTVNDYLNAVNDKTAMILKVHRSNFALRGFVKEPAIAELSEKLPEGIIIAVDQGSGVLDENLPGETTVGSFLKSGSSIVTFSADKILGGPQAGIIAGNENLIRKLETHPLTRTFRPGKTVYSLLEAVLINRINNTTFSKRSYITGILSGGSEAALKKCRSLKRGLSSEIFRILPGSICIGGGSTPDEYFDSYTIRITSGKLKPAAIMNKLRELNPPVIGSIKNGMVCLNPIALNENQLKYLKSVLTALEKEL